MRYFGGKAQDGVYQKIINQIPPHTRYIEPFLGGGAIMRLKRPASMISIGMDRDESAIRYFKQALEKTGYIPNLSVSNTNALDFLSAVGRIFGPETFIYCDPPYPKGTRSDPERNRYRYEMTDNDHLCLLGIAKTMSCNLMISTYPNDMYKTELKNWRVIEFNSVKSNGDVAEELLFMNYPEPYFLHDYRYIGKDSGNRQDINRRIKRTARRILGWDKHERLKLALKLMKEMPADENKYLVAIAANNAFAAEMSILDGQLNLPIPDPKQKN